MERRYGQDDEARGSDPAERERMNRWQDACATASFIVDRFKADQQTGEARNLVESSLVRNIADAIMGTLKQTAADRKAGKTPETMTDRIQDLEAAGDER